MSYDTHDLYDLYEDIKEHVERIPPNDPVLSHYLYLARYEMAKHNKDNKDIYSLYASLCRSIQQKMRS